MLHLIVLIMLQLLLDTRHGFEMRINIYTSSLLVVAQIERGTGARSALMFDGLIVGSKFALSLAVPCRTDAGSWSCPWKHPQRRAAAPVGVLVSGLDWLACRIWAWLASRNSALWSGRPPGTGFGWPQTGLCGLAGLPELGCMVWLASRIWVLVVPAK